MRQLERRAVPGILLALIVGAGLTACGGGGGGGGGGGPHTDPPDDTVAFTGFSFRTGSGVETSTPPKEDVLAIPPSVGAPLNLTIVFHFTGVPEGPFNQATLPVFTTPADVTPAAGAPASAATIVAKGDYAQVGPTVEFRPFVPTEPLQISLAAPPAAVPGLLPASTYTARVTTSNASKLPNLDVNGTVVDTSVRLGTTSNPAAYFVSDAVQSEAPRLIAATPAEGTTGFFPGTYTSTALGASAPIFPPGPEDFLLTYQVPVLPTADNLLGRDVDGDGLAEPAFSFRSRATRLIVAHTLPAGLFGPHPEIPALSGFVEAPGAVAPTDGSAVFLFGGPFPTSDPIETTPSSLAVGADASLLFAILPVDEGTDRLTVVDHVLGDPFEALAAQAPGGGSGSLETGLADAVGLTTLVDGRLVVFDRATTTIVELLPEVLRSRPSPESADPGRPQLLSLAQGFRSEPLDADVLDLAQAPSGELYALARLPGEALPAIVRLAPLDPDADGVLQPGDGLFSGSEQDVVLRLLADYSDVAVSSESRLLALDRAADAIDEIDLESGAVVRVLDEVAGFGQPLPGGASPALSLALGCFSLDARASLVSNDDSGAVLRVEPAGVLPVGAELTLMQGHGFSSLYGTNALNVDPSAQVSAFGAQELVSVSTAVPTLGQQAPIDDVFQESFDDAAFEDPTPQSTAPVASWAATIAGGTTTGGLRASVGVSETAELGDFRPIASLNFDPAFAYRRAPLPWPSHDEQDKEEQDLDWTATDYVTVLLNTDSQEFPLAGGITPGIFAPVTVLGGHFSFRDFIIPLGVRVVARGSNPLVITATGKVEIHGVLDVSGVDGLGDDSFDSAFLPVRGGPGGPGAGRGGDGHPTLSDPSGPGSIDQYVTPERGERGTGPQVGAAGSLTYKSIGGHGGLSTVGYAPNAEGYPIVPLAQANGNVGNDEHHRPPGGGGGSFYTRGDRSHDGAGVYFVQSSSTWFPFSKCPTNDKIRDATYGNEENLYSGQSPDTPLQCVSMEGTPEDPVRKKPPADPGDRVFVDGSPDNDYIGPDGELSVLIGGQGGGGGGTRVDSMRHSAWGLGPLGLPTLPGPPFYPLLLGGVFFAPSVYDAKGGAGGGGGGAVQIRCFTDILISKTGHIDATGGHGGGGEVVQNSQIGGGGGGGSGGAILLQAAGAIRIEGDRDHRSASFTDSNGLQGASLEVSGGFGRDAQTDTPLSNFDLQAWTYDFTRSDGGQGGLGLIQLQQGDGTGMPLVQEGAFLFAKKRLVLKKGAWTGHGAGAQRDHPDVLTATPPPTSLWYVDMLHYREFKPENVPQVPVNWYYVLNGSFPPLIPSIDGNNDQGLINQYPAGSGQFWADTSMIEHAGRMVAREPVPQQIMQVYAGFDPVTLTESSSPPGTLYPANASIPMSIYLAEPDGTPLKVPGTETFDPDNIIDRLPVVPPAHTPPPFGTVSQGISRWLDFNGVSTRLRDDSGRTPPFFAAVHGTYNEGRGPIPAGKTGQVIVGSPVVGKPAHFVVNAGGQPFDPGLFGKGAGNGNPPDPPYNDIKVDAPDDLLLLEDAISSNATVTLSYQGAYPVRAGAGTPDPATLTSWVSDLQSLTGYPLVRFRVVFDVGVDPSAFPFGVDSFRPLVDYVRVRATY